VLKFLLIFFVISKNLFALEYTKNDGAYLKILNKQTSKNYDLTIPLGQSFEVGENEITIYQCLSLEKEKSNDAIALLKFKSDNQYNFLGWIIKSSPSLVSIEDSIFDIKLKDCIFQDPIFPDLKEIN
tara:strand:+ start:193 stop:573 length:381 start_codon:yes stop_codon:yes gene_type:complete